MDIFPVKLEHPTNKTCIGRNAGIHPSRRLRSVSPSRSRPGDFDTLTGALQAHAASRPNATAYFLIDAEGRPSSLTYKELVIRAERCAGVMQHSGINPGDRVAILMETGADLVSVFFGCLLAGAIPIMMPRAGTVPNHPSWQRDATAAVRLMEPSLLWVDDRTPRRLRTLVENHVACPILRQVPSSPVRFSPPPAIESHGIAYIQFTASTEVHGQAVIVTHQALIANIERLSESCVIDQGDLMCSWLPLHQSTGLVAGLLLPMLCGIPAAVMSPLAFVVDAARWLWSIHHFRATLSPAPNVAYRLCADRLNDEQLAGLDLSSWRIAFNGVEFVDSTTLDRFTDRYAEYGFRPEAMYPVYVMAETVLATTVSPIDEEPSRMQVDAEALECGGRVKPSQAPADMSIDLISVGSALSDHEIRIVDNDGESVGVGQQGQVIVRGPSVVPGYFRDQVSTQATFREGWLWTGDLGFFWDDELYVCGPLDDLLHLENRTIHAHRIERCAAEIDEIRAGYVAAFAVGDPPKLVLVLESRLGDEVVLRDVLRKVADRIEATVGIRPTRIIPAPPRSLPRTSSGKLDRGPLRRLAIGPASVSSTLRLIE